MIGTSDTDNKYQFKNVGHQYYAVISANIIMLSHGCIVGWMSPSLPILQSENTPLETGPLTTEQTSWIGSMACIGALVGSFTFGYISHIFGCKRTIVFITFPAMLVWFSVIFGTLVYHLYIGRFISGWCAGGIQVCIPIYISEIAEDRIRGRLGSIFQLTRNIGILLAYIMGSFLQYTEMPYVFISLPILFFISFVFLPSTPQYLLKIGKIEEAKKSLKFYKGCKNKCKEETQALEDEFTRLQIIAKQTKESDDIHMSDLLEPVARKGLIIGIVLAALNQLTGCFAIVSYAANIFEESGTSLDPHTSSIILAIIQICGTLLTAQLADVLGRKFLLIVSLFGCAVGLLCMSSYLYFDNCGYDVSMFRWVPVVSLSFVMLTGSFGIIPLTMICIVEVLPTKIRQFGLSFCTAFLNISAFIVVKFFPILSNIINLYGCMLILGVGCTLGAVFIIFIMQETNGISLDKIRNDSEKGISNNGTNCNQK